jgi:hypothetical protein
MSAVSEKQGDSVASKLTCNLVALLFKTFMWGLSEADEINVGTWLFR